MIDVPWDLDDQAELDDRGDLADPVEVDVTDDTTDTLDEDTGREGHPPGPGELGAECRYLSDCNDGFCITDAMFDGFEGGYCTALDCDPEGPAVCGEYGICVELFPDTLSACIRTCETVADCRTDQDCIGICIPDSFTSYPDLPGIVDAEDTLLIDILGRIDPSRLQLRIAILSGAQPWPSPTGSVTIGSRAVGSPDHEIAIGYLTGELESVGLPVERTDFRMQGADCSNLEAVLAGSSPDLDPILVTAHYDSIASFESSWDPYTDPAPGAVDNGTGVAFVLEMANILSEIHSENQAARDVHFILFDCEELGLYGSEHYVQQLLDQESEVGCQLNVDMVGWYHEATPNRVWYVYSGAHEAVGALGVEAFESFSDALPIPTDNDFAGASDHAPFLEAGMCVASLSTFPTLSTYHTFEDTYYTVDWSFYQAVVRGSAAALAAWMYHGEDVF